MNLQDNWSLLQKMRPPVELTAMRLHLAPSTDKTKKDRAGVEGNWHRYFFFMDHRLVFYPFIPLMEVSSSKCCCTRGFSGEFSDPLSEQSLELYSTPQYKLALMEIQFHQPCLIVLH